MTAPRIQLPEIIMGVDEAIKRQRLIAHRSDMEGVQLQRLEAAMRALEWLMKHEAEVKAYVSSKRAEG